MNIVDDVLTFCMSTDICNQTGLTFNDFMEMDLVTFKQIKDKYIELDKPRQEALKKMQEQMSNNQSINSTKNFDMNKQTNIKARMDHERRRVTGKQ